MSSTPFVTVTTTLIVGYWLSKLVNCTSTNCGPPLRSSNLQTASDVVEMVARANSTASPSTRTENEPPSVSITLVYAFGEGGVVVSTAVVVVVVAGGAAVVVVAGGAVVVVAVSPAVGGLVAVGELDFGWVRGVDAVSALRDDAAASSVSDLVVLVSTCWVVVVTATVVVVLDCVGISDSTVGTSVEVGAASATGASSPSISSTSGSASIARIAAIPSAVGTFVTTLRTLPTAAAAMVTATMVATSQAIPTPAGFLILVVWYTFSCSATHLDNSSIRIEESHRWLR